ncbi:hypothetical protein JCM19297_3337 [Nonlabens ulvanivorans]|nr:hypothetical protein [Nonlabens ulvanivorans]GAK88813.1 hypothetical protein JCM19297_3337 [Nonlabens ulvanivorans]
MKSFHLCIIINHKTIHHENPVKSLFNLIEIFRKGAYKNQSPLIAEKHCENLSLHDYYCDQDHLGI